MTSGRHMFIRVDSCSVVWIRRCYYQLLFFSV